MAIGVVVGIAADAVSRKVRRVPRRRQALQGELLAGAFPAFEQDDDTLAVNNLRQLERRQPILQRAQRRSIVPREGISPFKFC